MQSGYYLIILILFLIIIFTMISDVIRGSYNLCGLLFILMLSFVAMLMINYNIDYC